MRQLVNGYTRTFGIANAHWRVFQEVAAQGPRIILVRGGKESSIPWIERGFPAKPPELEIKVDPQIGLLVARNDEYGKVRAAGHFILERAGQGFVVKMPSGPKPIETLVPKNLMGECDYKNWQREGLVLSKTQFVPFTSDYDIAAVIDLKDPRWGRTFLSEPVLGEKNLTNMYIQPVLDALNARMGNGTCLARQPRVQHGTQAQYGGSPLNKPGEPVLVFFPNGKVEQLGGGTVEEGLEDLKAILRESLPSTADSTPGKVIQGPWKR